MSIWFVSRHSGAIAWLTSRRICPDHIAEHLDSTLVQPGDTVIGTLPIPLVEELNRRGIRYLHLSLRVPKEWRGRELTAAQLVEAGAKLEEYRIIRLDSATEEETFSYEHSANHDPWPNAEPGELQENSIHVPGRVCK